LLVRDLATGKTGTIGFENHEASASHKEVAQVVIVLPTTCRDIGDMMSEQHTDMKKFNRQCLLKIPSNLQVLARQGIARNSHS